MVKMTFIKDQQRIEVNAKIGQTLLEVARENNVDLIGACDGNCACGSCHVYIDENTLKKIIYVSCDPVTLARDLKELNNKYEIKDITLVNMFPKTEHVETVVNLERK